MHVALAVMGAIVAALLETSVATFATVGGAKPDLVLVTSLVVVVTVGAEAGFAWAFTGGLTLDMLSAPARPVGSTVVDRKSTRLNSSHVRLSRMPSSA